MHITNIFVRNWASLPDGHYEPGPLTLITGGNGSGKTTLIDAIQTVMTAARSGFYHFNPGQDESSQNSKKKQHRTLASYALGCDDGSYARTGTQDSIVGLNFSPAPNESGEVFCAMLVVRASLLGVGNLRHAKAEDPEMYIISGHHVILFEHLKHPSADRWLDIEQELATHLKSAFGRDDAGKHRAEQFQKKEAYLTRLYAKFQGKKGSINTESMKQMVKSFVKFMAYRPFGDIDQFMRGSVLEAVDNRETITDISSMMKRVAEMRREAEHIDRAIVHVSNAIDLNQDFVKNWLKRRENEAVLWRLKHRQKHDQYLVQKKRQREHEEAVKQADRELKQIENRLKDLRDTEIVLTSKCRGDQAFLRKEDLEEQIEAAEQEIQKNCVAMVAQSQIIEGNKNSLREINFSIQNRGQSPWVKKLADSQSRLAEAAGLLERAIDLTQIIRAQEVPDVTEAVEIYTDIERAVQGLLDDVATRDGCIVSTLNTELMKKNMEIELIQKALKELEQDIGDLKNDARVTYQNDTLRTVAEIIRRFPGANPRILGDQIEIVEECWQNAIEGFLGGSRENILVDEAYEADAHRVARSISPRVRVVQGAKAIRDSRDKKPHPQSIVNLMEFTDEYARAYLQASYGNVQMADSVEALKMMSRGLTMDGDATSGYTYFTAYEKDRNLVCGKAARARRLAALENELIDQKEAKRIANDQASEVNSLLVALNGIRALDVTTPLLAVSDSQDVITQCEKDIANLDLSELGDLEAQLQKAKDDYAKLSEKKSEISQSRGGDMAILYGQSRDPNNPSPQSIVNLVKRLSKEVEDFETQADDCLLNYVSWRQERDRDLNEESIIDQVIAKAESDGQEEIEVIERSLGSTTWITHLTGDLRDAVSAYNQIAVQDHYIKNELEPLVAKGVAVPIDNVEFFRAGLRNDHALKNLHNLLKNNILVQRKDSLATAQERFDHTFTMSLANEILSQIERSKQTLKKLNSELSNHKFDDETFKFDHTDNREFSRYRRCFEELRLVPPASVGQTVSIFENQQLSEDVRQTLDALRELLLQNDNAKAHAELERIADYRNYFNYEIFKMPEGKEPIPLSTYGTGSGGQLETPFYVIMAAAFQSAMGFHEGSCHLRTIIIDESFSKLDEKRSRRILDYLSGKLGLQVIFAMPSVKSGPFKSICTNQMIVQKIKDNNPPPGSELSTRVIVDSQALNHEAIGSLFNGYKQNVSKAASQAFLKLLEEEGGVDA